MEPVEPVEPVGLSGGLALFWKSYYKFDILHSDKKNIYVRVEYGVSEFFVTFVYGSGPRIAAFGVGTFDADWSAWWEILMRFSTMRRI